MLILNLYSELLQWRVVQMRNLKAIYMKEMKSYFNSPMAYIFLVIFAVINGYFFTRTFFLFNQSDMLSLFNIVTLIYIFFIPAVTMSLIAREKNLGTMEVMCTLPLKDMDFVHLIRAFIQQERGKLVECSTFILHSGTKSIRCSYR